MTDKLRVEKHRDVDMWAVIEDVAEPCESNNYGLLADGFPGEGEAQAWLEDYRRERQCQEWTEHAHQDVPCDPSPF